MSALAADGANGKRKREDRDDATRRPKERRLRLRQDELEEEFTAAYHAPTGIYKLLEVRHMSCPLFLPRTLSYRLVPPRRVAAARAAARLKAESAMANGTVNGNGKADVKMPPPLASTAAPLPAPARLPTAGATLREFKIGMTADTIDYLKREGMRVGLLFSLYSAARSHRFGDNPFELVATCLVPVPCAKEAKLPQQFMNADATLVVLAVQVVQINDVVDQLAAASQYVFAAAPADRKPVLGADLLREHVAAREPLFGNLVRIDVNKRRASMYSIELQAVASAFRGVVKLQLRMVWDHPSKANKMARLQEIVRGKCSDYITTKGDVSDELSVPRRLKPSPWTRRGNTNVWFHYLYHSMLRRMSEKRPDYSCAWCNLYAGSLRGLVSHLVSSHSRFRFHVSAGHDNIPHIYVMPRGTKAAGRSSVNVEPSLCELNLDADADLDRIEHHFTYISARKRNPKGAHAAERADLSMERMHEFDELEELAEEKPQEFYAPLLQRQYFHSRTGAVVLDHEKDYDSDDDVDEEWITQQSERLLDEFEDVSLEEKEFMKKWNRHVKECRVLADFMVASSCRLFAKRHGKWLIETGLRYNFLLHLFNLWDNSLLNSRAIIDCILIVDHYAVLQEVKEQENGAIKTPDAEAGAAAPPASAQS